MFTLQKKEIVIHLKLSSEDAKEEFLLPQAAAVRSDRSEKDIKQCWLGILTIPLY